MNLLESLRSALGSLAANKMRSSLTMLGMIIGVGAVITLMSIGRGAQEMVTQPDHRAWAPTSFSSRPARVRRAASGPRLGPRLPSPTRMRSRSSEAGDIPEVVAVAPESNSFGQMIVGSNNVSTRIVGTTPDYESVRNFHVARGSS